MGVKVEELQRQTLVLCMEKNNYQMASHLINENVLCKSLQSVLEHIYLNK